MRIQKGNDKDNQGEVDRRAIKMEKDEVQFNKWSDDGKPVDKNGKVRISRIEEWLIIDFMDFNTQIRKINNKIMTQ